MKEYLLKQLKTTCVLFFIACKISLGLVKKKNGNPGGRGVFGLGNPGGRGITVIQEIRVGGGSKNLAIRRGVWIFSGITHYKSSALTTRSCCLPPHREMSLVTIIMRRLLSKPSSSFGNDHC